MFPMVGAHNLWKIVCSVWAAATFKIDLTSSWLFYFWWIWDWL